MDLNDLKALGALVTSPPVKKNITWQPTDPETGQPVGEPVNFDVYVKRPSAGWLQRARADAGQSVNGIEVRSAYISHAIIFGAEDLEQHFTYDEAYMLQDALAEALFAAYLAVNSTPPAPANAEDAEADFAKNSEPTHGSGTNSSEPASAAAP